LVSKTLVWPWIKAIGGFLDQASKSPSTRQAFHRAGPRMDVQSIRPGMTNFRKPDTRAPAAASSFDRWPKYAPSIEAFRLQAVRSSMMVAPMIAIVFPGEGGLVLIRWNHFREQQDSQGCRSADRSGLFIPASETILFYQTG
jgi:hypothetical protein